MDQKPCCPKILAADPTDEKTLDTLSEQAQSRSPGSKIPSSDPTSDKLSDMLNEQDLSGASGSVLLTFDASVANTFIVKREWEGLDEYLGKLIATILKKTPDEVVMMHPGLFMIPREERLLDLISDQKYEEAASFCQKLVVSLQGCQGRFVALDLMSKIDDLNTILNTRSMPAIRHSAERIETAISDYIHLYFPSAIRRDNDKIEGLWQFAMKVPKLDKQARRHAFRCLACGWICPGSCNISHMRLHIVQSQYCIGCSKVTEDMLDRLKAVDETKDVPNLEIVQYLSKNRNMMSESVSSATTQLAPSLSGEASSATGPMRSTSVKEKRARDEPIGAANSHWLSTYAKKIKPQLCQMAQVLRSETVALRGHIDTLLAPEAQGPFLDKLFNVHRVALDLSFLLKEIDNVPASAPIDGSHSE